MAKSHQLNQQCVIVNETWKYSNTFFKIQIQTFVHPCEKGMGLFFQNQNLSYMPKYRLIVFDMYKKNPLEKLNSAKYLIGAEWWLIENSTMPI